MNQKSVYMRAYYEKHGDELRRRERDRNSLFKEQAYAILGDKCQVCGCWDTRCLHIDHRHGNAGGRIRSLNGTTLYRRIVNGLEPTDKYQLLCANCNWVKRNERGEIRVTSRGKLSPDKLQYHRTYRAQSREEIINRLGGKCQCGIADPRVLQLDHVSRYRGKGEDRAGNVLVNAIRKGRIALKELQVLCANCNWRKAFSGRELCAN